MAEVIRLRPTNGGADDPPVAIGPARAEAIELARSSVERLYAADAAAQRLGVQVSDVRPGHAVARMAVTEDMRDGHGMAHGGYVFLLADTAFAFACNTYGQATLARGAEVQFIAAAKPGDELIATAYERARYGSDGIYDVTVRRSDGAIIAEFRGQSHVPAQGAATEVGGDPSGGQADPRGDRQTGPGATRPETTRQESESDE